MQLYKQALNAHIYSDMSLLRQFLLLATTLTATQSLTCTSGNTFKLKGQTLTTPPRQANVSCGALITFVENEYHEIHSRSGGDEPDVMQNMSEPNKTVSDPNNNENSEMKEEINNESEREGSFFKMIRLRTLFYVVDNSTIPNVNDIRHWTGKASDFTVLKNNFKATILVNNHETCDGFLTMYEEGKQILVDYAAAIVEDSSKFDMSLLRRIMAEKILPPVETRSVD